MRERVERVGAMFAEGYHAVLEDDRLEVLVPRLERVEAEYRGFAYEGAGMALALLDYLTPWRRGRVADFLAGPADAHAYMVHVGVGWWMARVPGRVERARRRLEPLLGWLALDGYGFHEGFFKWPRYLSGQPAPRRVKGYGRRVFDQGLGRSVWFVVGADASLIPRTIEGFGVERRSDLWSGVGLACAYAGGAGEAAVRELRSSAGGYLPEMAQGVAFAAKARVRAGNVNSNTEVVSQVICGLSAEAVARVTDEALENLPMNGTEPAYELWRRRVQARFAERAPV